jgi:hypothetical protein
MTIRICRAMLFGKSAKMSDKDDKMVRKTTKTYEIGTLFALNE